MRILTSIAVLIVCLNTVGFSQDTLRHITVSKDIEVIQISKHSYVHVTYVQVPPFGRVASNGLIYTDNKEALLFDTPMNDSLTKDLVTWITDSLKVRIVGFVPNHWHDDCMGGLNYLNTIGIPSYANERTRTIAISKNLPVPQHGFADSLILYLDNQAVVCRYFGPTHTVDNIVTWIPSERVLFGGCMVKALKSETLGNLADADLTEWP